MTRPPRWSRRTDHEGRVSPLQEALTAARSSGRTVLDLTCSNPTEVGLLHPPEVLRRLCRPSVARYRPEALGLTTAREAVSAYYGRRGILVDPARVWLTSGTSEAYWQLLTLLCDPTDRVAVPKPGYPLLDHLAAAANVELVDYRLRHDGDWYLDLASVAARLDDPRVRAIVAVAPHNPTGHVPTTQERKTVVEHSAARSVPLVIDEVFADHGWGPSAVTRWFPSTPGFVLSGLSKVAALPQMKLSWGVVTGPEAFARPALARLELLADAFLSVSAPAQEALPDFLLAAEPMQLAIRRRCIDNLRVLDEALCDQPVSRDPCHAGWVALLRLPALDDLDDEGWALDFLHAGLLVQPGYLFELDGPPRVVLSLLTPPERWRDGVVRLLEAVRTHLGSHPRKETPDDRHLHIPPSPPPVRPAGTSVAVPLNGMGNDDGTEPLTTAVERAQMSVNQQAEDGSGDLEPILRAALARSGLTWELVGHRLEAGDPPTLHATFVLGHVSSGDTRRREFPIALPSDQPSETTIANALNYLWSHSLREVLAVPPTGAPGPTSHLQPTLKIPKIEE